MSSRLNPLAGNVVKRLSDETRNLAEFYLTGGCLKRNLNGEFSLAALHLPESTPPALQHARLARQIAERSRLEILPEERLAGAAPNLDAMMHQIPGSGGLSSISHVTIDFGNAVRLGLSGLEEEIRGRQEGASGKERIFHQALLEVIGAMRCWVGRYAAEYQRRSAAGADPQHLENYRKIAANLKQVPENPPQNFPQAVQSLWSFFEFQRLCGNWSGIGCIDRILGDYLERDLAAGTITMNEARELLAHFWIKGTEWCYGLRAENPLTPGSGDAQHYQNVVLGGTRQDGSAVDNAVTHLVLEVIEELHISDYPVAVRLHRGMSEDLLRLIARVQLLGGGIVSVYSEEVVLQGLRNLGYPEEEIFEFTNDGCWEVLIPGKTHFCYTPFDAYAAFEKALYRTPDHGDMEMLRQSWLRELDRAVDGVREHIRDLFYVAVTDPVTGHCRYEEKYHFPDAVLSLLMPSCRESGRSYFDFGAKYQVWAVHAGGLPDVANSFRAIEEMVFRRKRLTLAALKKHLQQNWANAEPLRLECANTIRYYGNDDPEADRIMGQIYTDYARSAARQPQVLGVRSPAGISTFGREIQWAVNRGATAFGKFAGEYLAPNLSPTPGTDRTSLSAVLHSYCSMDLTQTPNGCPLDLRLSAGIRKMPAAEDTVMQLLRVFREKGGFYLQLDVVDADMLRAAQKDPDRFPNLAVRISGWSARFASLEKKWQDMIINRTVLEEI